jgi:hypothetical protein
MTKIGSRLLIYHTPFRCECFLLCWQALLLLTGLAASAHPAGKGPIDNLAVSVVLVDCALAGSCCCVYVAAKQAAFPGRDRDASLPPAQDHLADPWNTTFADNGVSIPKLF